jgi:hypothetical protein
MYLKCFPAYVFTPETVIAVDNFLAYHLLYSTKPQITPHAIESDRTRNYMRQAILAAGAVGPEWDFLSGWGPREHIVPVPLPAAVTGFIGEGGRRYQYYPISGRRLIDDMDQPRVQRLLHNVLEAINSTRVFFPSSLLHQTSAKGGFSRVMNAMASSLPRAMIGIDKIQELSSLNDLVMPKHPTDIVGNKVIMEGSVPLKGGLISIMNLGVDTFHHYEIRLYREALALKYACHHLVTSYAVMEERIPRSRAVSNGMRLRWLYSSVNLDNEFIRLFESMDLSLQLTILKNASQSGYITRSLTRKMYALVEKYYDQILHSQKVVRSIFYGRTSPVRDDRRGYVYYGLPTDPNVIATASIRDIHEACVQRVSSLKDKLIQAARGDGFVQITGSFKWSWKETKAQALIPQLTLDTDFPTKAEDRVPEAIPMFVIHDEKGRYDTVTLSSMSYPPLFSVHPNAFDEEFTGPELLRRYTQRTQLLHSKTEFISLDDYSPASVAITGPIVYSDMVNTYSSLGESSQGLQ